MVPDLLKDLIYLKDGTGNHVFQLHLILVLQNRKDRGRIFAAGWSILASQTLTRGCSCTLKSWAEGMVERPASEFYDRSFESAEFVEVVRRNNANREGLEKAQAAYCLDLFRGVPSVQYAELRQHIGMVHARIGVTPEYYQTSYQFYYDILFRMVRRKLMFRPGRSGHSSVEQTSAVRPVDHNGLLHVVLHQQVDEPGRAGCRDRQRCGIRQRPAI